VQKGLKLERRDWIKQWRCYHKKKSVYSSYCWGLWFFGRP